MDLRKWKFIKDHFGKRRENNDTYCSNALHDISFYSVVTHVAHVPKELQIYK